jgi:glucose-6-phosphate isomerase
MMTFYPGFDITPTTNPLGFRYGEGTFGPSVENRSLDSIRKSLRDPDCAGPDPVYAIAMDVGKVQHKPALHERNLLYGAVTYAAGTLGGEPVRSQGHIHKKVRGNTMSPPEIYEIWAGKAIVYLQEHADTNPGRCFAVEASPGEVVIVPPDWVHVAISVNPNEPLTFGAWCDRQYGFEYERVRALHGMAWFPLLNDNGDIKWMPNKNYRQKELLKKKPEDYHSLGIRKNVPIYSLFEEEPDVLLYVPNPELALETWKNFIP